MSKHTPERRPDMYKTPAKIDTSAERVQKSAKSMHDWHERGELPPVGSEVELQSTYAHDWHSVVFVADVGDGDVVVMFDGQKHLNRAPSNFRPVQPKTERDELIAIIQHTPGGYDKLADAILAAGFKRGAA